MPPRKTTDFGALFESIVEDLRIQVAASVDKTLSDFSKRIARLERRIDQLDPEGSEPGIEAATRACSLCERKAVARGLCSAHYQQWRYRERKTTERTNERAAKHSDQNDTFESTVILPQSHPSEITADN